MIEVTVLSLEHSIKETEFSIYYSPCDANADNMIQVTVTFMAYLTDIL